MSTLFDDVSRIIASPISRRQAFRMVSGAVGGVVLTSLGLGSASRTWAAAGVACGDGHCPPGLTCCSPQGANPICCPSNYTCCGPSPGGQGNAFCCAPGCTCCPVQGQGNAICCSGRFSSGKCPTGKSCTGSSGCTCNKPPTCPPPS
jgi:hypothetical protein